MPYIVRTDLIFRVEFSSAKPMLKKVAKTETRLAKFDKEKLKKSGAFRAELKSTGACMVASRDNWRVQGHVTVLFIFFQESRSTRWRRSRRRRNPTSAKVCTNTRTSPKLKKMRKREGRKRSVFPLCSSNQIAAILALEYSTFTWGGERRLRCCCCVKQETKEEEEEVEAEVCL